MCTRWSEFATEAMAEAALHKKALKHLGIDMGESKSGDDKQLRKKSSRRMMRSTSKGADDEGDGEGDGEGGGKDEDEGEDGVDEVHAADEADIPMDAGTSAAAEATVPASPTERPDVPKRKWGLPSVGSFLTKKMSKSPPPTPSPAAAAVSTAGPADGANNAATTASTSAEATKQTLQPNNLSAADMNHSTVNEADMWQELLDLIDELDEIGLDDELAEVSVGHGLPPLPRLANGPTS